MKAEFHCHYCELCGHQWRCEQTKKKCDASGTGRAAKVNGIGPYCDMCLHLIMAARYAKARGVGTGEISDLFEKVRFNPRYV